MEQLERISDYTIEMWNYVTVDGSKTKLILLSSFAGIIILNSYVFKSFYKHKFNRLKVKFQV